MNNDNQANADRVRRAFDRLTRRRARLRAPGNPVPLAATLIQRLRRAGWRSGPPRGLEPTIRRAQTQAGQNAVCPLCGTPGLLTEWFQRGDDFRTVLACPRCPYGRLPVW